MKAIASKLRAPAAAGRARVRLALCLWLAGLLALAAPGCDDSEPSGGGASAPAGIVLHLPADSSIADQNPTATPVADLATMPAPPDGGRMLAAGVFEPSGLEIPEGLKVTWTLAEAAAAGKPLDILQLDEQANRWNDTGWDAAVDADGKTATGTVFHFSTLGVRGRDEDDPESGQTRSTYIKLVKQAEVESSKKIKVVSKPDKDAVAKIYTDWAAGDPDKSMPPEIMKKIYGAGDFDTVKTLIEDKVISPRHSLDMADIRIAMNLEVLGEVAKKNGWVIYRSDSGNQSAGMSSDIDQTVYVYLRDKDGNLVRAEKFDGELVRQFHEEFNKRFAGVGIDTTKLDIATIAGRDKFPDWRVTSAELTSQARKMGRRSFGEHLLMTMEGLRDTPGAYTYCGAVVQQMQLRAMDLIDKQLRAGASPNAVNPPDDRPTHPILQTVGLERLRWLGLCEISADATGKVSAREVFQKGEAGRPGALDVMFDSMRPELVRGHAYDAAVANYLEFMHHLKDKNPAVKYHLRALDDGLRLLAVLEARRGGGVEPTVFEKLTGTEAERRRHLAQLVGLPEDGIMAKRWSATFEVSAELRRLHKDQKLTDESAAKAFEKLAKEFARDDADLQKNRQQYLELARREYNRRSAEFMIHNIMTTSQDRVLAWLNYDPANPDARPDPKRFIDDKRVRKAMKKTPLEWLKVRNEVYKNFSDMARIQLIYSLREMDDTLVRNVLEYNKKRLKATEFVKLQKLANEARSPWFHYNHLKEFPIPYTRIMAGRAAKRTAAWMAEQVHNQRQQLMYEAGFTNGEPTKLFSKLGFADYDTRINNYFQARGATGVVRRYVRNAVFDVGNIGAGLNVARALSESGGDVDVAEEVLMNELVYALPVVGRAKSFYDANGATDRFVIVACMVVPQLGMVTMAYSMGEAGLVLFEHEYSQPLANAVSDAIYRGYVGPSLYYYGKTPPEFTEDHKAQLERVRTALADMEGKSGPGYDKQRAELLPREKQLALWQSAWNSYWAEHVRHEGGALRRILADNYPSLEGWIRGGHEVQKRLILGNATRGDPLLKDDPLFMAGTLLQRVTPIVFYSPGFETREVVGADGEKVKLRVAMGPVDFTLKPLEQAQKDRLKKLPELIAAATDEASRTKLEVEQAELEQHERQYIRAQKYLDKARSNHELMHQIRRDSLYPYMLSDPSHQLVNTRQFVKDWVVVRRQILPDALKAIDVGDSALARTLNLGTIPDAAMTELQDRLESDLARSKRLWLGQKYVESEQAKNMEKVAARREVNEGIQLLMDAATDSGLDFPALAEAILMRHVPDQPPHIEVDVRQVPSKDKEGEVEFRPDVKITANPEIYLPPWSCVSYPLSPKMALEAGRSGQFKDFPLLDKELRDGLVAWGSGQNKPTQPVILTFVFCADQKVPGADGEPARVVPETVDGLADLPWVPSVKELGALSWVKNDNTEPVPDRVRLMGVAATGLTGTADIEIIASGPWADVDSDRFEDSLDRYRADNPNPGTYVHFRSDAIERLSEPGAEPATAMLVVLQRSASADGPWDTLGAGLVSRKTEGGKGFDDNEWDKHKTIATQGGIWKDPKNDDEYVVMSPLAPAWREDSGPFFRLVSATGEPTRLMMNAIAGQLPETGLSFSEVIEPEFGIVFIDASPRPRYGEEAPPSDQQPDRTYKAKEFPPLATQYGHWDKVRFGLGGTNHGSLVGRVKFDVSLRGDTRSFWSKEILPPEEITEMDPVVYKDMGMCKVRFPAMLPGDAPSGLDMQVTATGRGASFSRQFHVPTPPVPETVGQASPEHFELLANMELAIRKFNATKANEFADKYEPAQMGKARTAASQAHTDFAKLQDARGAIGPAAVAYRKATDADYQVFLLQQAERRQEEKRKIKSLETYAADGDADAVKRLAEEKRYQQFRHACDVMTALLTAVSRAKSAKQWDTAGAYLKQYMGLRGQAAGLAKEHELKGSIETGSDVMYYGHLRDWAYEAADAAAYRQALDWWAQRSKFAGLSQMENCFKLAQVLSERGDVGGAVAIYKQGEAKQVEQWTKSREREPSEKLLASWRPGWWPEPFKPAPAPPPTDPAQP